MAELTTRYENGKYIVHSNVYAVDMFSGTFEEVREFINNYFDEVESF